MPKISNDTVVVAYDIADDERREELRDYLKSIGANARTESVFEFEYAPPLTPKYEKFIREIQKIIDRDDEDRVYVWDLDDGQLRRVAVHRLKS